MATMKKHTKFLLFKILNFSKSHYGTMHGKNAVNREIGVLVCDKDEGGGARSIPPHSLVSMFKFIVISFLSFCFCSKLPVLIHTIITPDRSQEP